MNEEGANMHTIVNTLDAEKLERLDRIANALERLVPPEGSESSVLLADTRSGSDDKRKLVPASASPLPDQGWVAPVLAVRDQMLKEAAAHRKMAEIESNPVTFMERRRHYQGAADGLVAYASLLEEAVGVIRTQSVADGDEAAKPPPIVPQARSSGGFTIEELRERQLSRKERSVSGNSEL